MPRDFSQFSDAELYKKCCEIGSAMLRLRRKFCGMLPEVQKRKLYEKYGIHSVYEFAAKLGGVNHEIVEEILRIHTLLDDKPVLQGKLVHGEIGYTKLRAVALVATPETQMQWLEKVETMSKPALELYVRELKKESLHGDESQPGFPGKLPEKVPQIETLSLTVKTATAIRMRVFKKRLEKKLKKPLSWDETLMALLDGEQIRRVVRRPMRRVLPVRPVRSSAAVQKPPTRHIPAAITYELEEKYHGACAFKDCTKPAEIFHHTERFALKPLHDVATIAPLCKPHERIAHSGLIENENQPPANWRLRQKPDKKHPKYFIDQLVQKFRKPLAAPKLQQISDVAARSFARLCRTA